MQQKSILICRYQSICEPDVIQGFQKNGYQVEEFTEIMEEIDGDVRYLKLLAEKVKNQTYDFIFSINFSALAPGSIIKTSFVSSLIAK